MVSAPSIPQSTSTMWDRRRWPDRHITRFGLRLLLGLPLAVIGVWTASQGYLSPGRDEIVAQANALVASGFSLADLSAAYPPAPVLTAIIVGSSLVGLSLACAFLAGTALHLAWERMIRRHVPWPTQAALIAGVTLIPAVWFVATQDLATIGGLAMLVIAVEGFIRFAFDGDTSGGFTAGLFLAAAFLFDPAAIAYAFSLALAAPLLASARYRGEEAAARATVAVLCFPVVAVLLGWAFLEWRFTGSAFTFLRDDLGYAGIDAGILPFLGDSVIAVAKDVLRSPIYLVIGALLVMRRPIAALGYFIPVAALILVQWAGFEYSSAASVVLLSFIGMVSVPYRPGRSQQFLMMGAAVAQLAINIAWPPTAAGLGEWLSLLS